MDFKQKTREVYFVVSFMFAMLVAWCLKDTKHSNVMHMPTSSYGNVLNLHENNSDFQKIIRNAPFATIKSNLPPSEDEANEAEIPHRPRTAVPIPNQPRATLRLPRLNSTNTRLPVNPSPVIPERSYGQRPVFGIEMDRISHGIGIDPVPLATQIVLSRRPPNPPQDGSSIAIGMPAPPSQNGSSGSGSSGSGSPGSGSPGSGSPQAIRTHLQRITREIFLLTTLNPPIVQRLFYIPIHLDRSAQPPVQSVRNMPNWMRLVTRERDLPAELRPIIQDTNLRRFVYELDVRRCLNAALEGEEIAILFLSFLPSQYVFMFMLQLNANLDTMRRIMALARNGLRNPILGRITSQFVEFVVWHWTDILFLMFMIIGWQAFNDYIRRDILTGNETIQSLQAQVQNLQRIVDAIEGGRNNLPLNNNVQNDRDLVGHNEDNLPGNPPVNEQNGPHNNGDPPNDR